MSTVAQTPGGRPAVPPLLRHLVDDAALFPPGNAPMPVALAEHRHHRAAPYSDLVGPLLVPSARIDELRALLGSGSVLDVGLISDHTELPGLRSAVEVVTADPRLRLTQVECPAAAGDVPTVVAVARVLAGIDGIQRYVEVPRLPGWLAAVRALTGHDVERPVAAKLRTGGLRADAFPSEDELAAFLSTCLDSDLPFKLTAGLHHAVRHTAADTGFEYHGYLNVLAAVGSDVRSTPGRAEFAQTTLTRTIAERASGVLADRVRPLLDGSGHHRRCFRSYGSCSVAEPLADLAELGLLDGRLLDHLPPAREDNG